MTIRPRLILVADADDPRAERLANLVSEAGIDATLTGRVAEADHLVSVGRYDAVLIDPAHAGSDFLPRLRRRLPAQVLVAWTPGASSAFAAEVLEHGADEALHGGMGAAEILARLRLALARDRGRRARVIELRGLRLDLDHGEVTWKGERLPLTTREREVLHVLAESADRTVRRETLYRNVWGYAMPRGDRSVDVNVKRLRAKLDAAGVDGVAVATVAGVGYRLETAPAPAVTAP